MERERASAERENSERSIGEANQKLAYKMLFETIDEAIDYYDFRTTGQYRDRYRYIFQVRQRHCELYPRRAGIKMARYLLSWILSTGFSDVCERLNIDPLNARNAIKGMMRGQRIEEVKKLLAENETECVFYAKKKGGIPHKYRKPSSGAGNTSECTG